MIPKLSTCRRDRLPVSALHGAVLLAASLVFAALRTFMRVRCGTDNLAQVLADEGRFAEAQSAVRRALELDGPNKAVAERTLHDIRQKIGAYTE